MLKQNGNCCIDFCCGKEVGCPVAEIGCQSILKALRLDDVDKKERS
jgi:hypothetical protein